MSRIEKKGIELNRIDVRRDNLELYYDFVESIKSRMEHPEWLGDFSYNELKDCLDNMSHIFLYESNGLLYASSMIIPAREKDLVKFGLSDIPFTYVIDYGPEAVSEDVRGNGIQLHILEDMDQYARNLGYKYAFTTVHPDNKHCIRNMEKHGFTCIGTQEFSRGIRNIYKKDL
ncbi:MAG: GNAT family N-acetyltransferase [Bacilli bacterium]|nr:GNAT family N-acetyltransferase [Bacilli bacterium]MBR6137149.1 GNAT family N-acetyltransferase [Bacilli bacterium]